MFPLCVSPNKPFQFSNGSISTALHEAIRSKDVVMIRALLNAGADTTIKDGYDHDCLESAKVHELDSDIIALMKK